ncbi:MAG: hypothetical protein JXB26_13045 [Candidatus Aminicenantes bacterium]|nr:hypothetical protein [Candidatus Aminicenantes bacterium]
MIERSEEEQRVEALRQVSGPSVGLLVTGILGAIGGIAGFIAGIIGWGWSSRWWRDVPDWYEQFWEGSFSIGTSFIGILVSAFVIYAALKMKDLEQWGICVAASILAMVPCVSPCCIVGLPVGIWCLVILTRPEVKAAFPGMTAV